MDDIVKEAMRKWPNVPHCTGWLGLDARGQWWIRDAQAQACGAFTSGHAGARGVRLEHARLIEFIGRNYEVDEAGQWFFQNGPQRVFVELESTPWIWRLQAEDGGLDGGLHVRTHTGLAADWRCALIDQDGMLYGLSGHGLGRVHPQDMGLAADAFLQGRWAEPEPVHASELPARFGFVRSPEARASGGAHSASGQT